MDFSIFKNAIAEQQEEFNKIKDTLNAQKFDEIAASLSKTFNDISTVAKVIPVKAKFELISILKSLLSLVLGLVSYRKKFDEPEKSTTQDETPIMQDSLDTPSANSQSETKTNGLEKGKTLTLTNPNLPNGAAVSQFPQAA